MKHNIYKGTVNSTTGKIDGSYHNNKKTKEEFSEFKGEAPQYGVQGVSKIDCSTYIRRDYDYGFYSENFFIPFKKLFHTDSYGFDKEIPCLITTCDKKAGWDGDDEGCLATIYIAIDGKKMDIHNSWSIFSDENETKQLISTLDIDSIWSVLEKYDIKKEDISYNEHAARNEYIRFIITESCNYPASGYSNPTIRVVNFNLSCNNNSGIYTDVIYDHSLKTLDDSSSQFLIASISEN